MTDLLVAVLLAENSLTPLIGFNLVILLLLAGMAFTLFVAWRRKRGRR